MRPSTKRILIPTAELHLMSLLQRCPETRTEHLDNLMLEELMYLQDELGRSKENNNNTTNNTTNNNRTSTETNSLTTNANTNTNTTTEKLQSLVHTISSQLWSEMNEFEAVANKASPLPENAHIPQIAGTRSTRATNGQNRLSTSSIQWREYSDDSGKTFFYNTFTRRSQWDLPSGNEVFILNDKYFNTAGSPTVPLEVLLELDAKRTQALRASGDNKTTPTSDTTTTNNNSNVNTEGMSALSLSPLKTALPSSAPPPIPLKSTDATDTTTTTTTATATASPQTAAPHSPAHIPAPKLEQDLPPPFLITDGDDTSTAEDTNIPQDTAVQADAQLPPLPPNWKAYRDPVSGNTYFHNEVTNQSTWSWPEN